MFPTSLRATPVAHGALGIADDPDQQPHAAAGPPRAPAPARRSGTKQEAEIALLKSEGGATIDEIMAATNRAGHAARGFVSGALKRKLGPTTAPERSKAGGAAT